MQSDDLTKYSTATLRRSVRKYVDVIRPAILQHVAKGNEKYPCVVQMDGWHAEVKAELATR